jgi:tRNA (cmo5U34)-methyltransferase
MADFTFAHREEGFDDHIEHSIRHYNSLIGDVINLSRYFVENDQCVVDIGCSTGKMLDRMTIQNEEIAPRAKYIGVENADGFKDIMIQRSQQNTRLELIFDDILNVNLENCSLITSIFTLQFISRQNRDRILKKIYNALNPGGAFIFSEKTVSEDARIQDMMTFTYYDYKRQFFDSKDILDKEYVLRNMLKPNTWQEIKSSLMIAGFDSHKIQPFWQNHLFVGALVLK